VTADPPSLRGQLLVAGPAMLDPRFARTVILVGEHSEEGAMGIVLNRPSEARVADAVPGLAELVSENAVVHVGGPVQREAVTALAEFDDPDQAAAIVFDAVGFARGDLDPALLAGTARRVRIFAGYAGWSAGQLEGELEQDDWILAAPEPDDIFSDEGIDLWASVLRRKGGRFELLARMPLDPSVN
jgi:putative transcriptional regulator